MLRFELDVVAADLAARTIEGVAVPYGEVGTIQGRRYRFAPGSLTLARSRPPLLVDHDRGRPVGVLAELVDGETAALARFTIDATQDGDTALVQAASGSRGALSVGVELVDATENGGVIDVARGLIHEVSLLALGAFASATVTRVAAEADDPGAEEAEVVIPGQEELELEPDPATDPTPAPPAEPEEDEVTEASTAAPMILAAHDRPERELLAGELVSLIVRAQHGEPDARRYLEAALTESISTDLSGVLPPSYESTVLGGKSQPRPLFLTFRGKPLPGVGLAVNKPRWTTRPDGAWAATVDDDAHSTKVVIGSDAANVERWDWAGAIPYVVVQRSSPDVIDSIYGEAVEDFHLDVETKIAGLLSLTAAGLDTTLGAGIASFFDANDRSPEVILVAPDVWGDLADAKALDSSVAGGGVSSGGELRSSFAGIPILASGSLTAGDQYLATKRALDVRITEPVRLTANAIGALNVELAVVGEGLFDVDYATEVYKLAPGALGMTARGRSSAK
jgi:hypothetical protein